MPPALVLEPERRAIAPDGPRGRPAEPDDGEEVLLEPAGVRLPAVRGLPYHRAARPHGERSVREQRDREKIHDAEVVGADGPRAVVDREDAAGRTDREDHVRGARGAE